MKISRIFHLGKSQYELDFVDVDVDKDTPLFLDPYFISKMEFPFAEEAYRTLKDYFDYLLVLLRAERFLDAREVFSFLGESNELCLGLSKGKPAGRGMGPADTEKIFQNLLLSKAYKTGIMEDIEDFRIFVPNVDKDKVSDMTANIIKRHLIKYTQEQCKLWDIPLTPNVPSGHYWNTDSKTWDNQYMDMLIVHGKKVILAPKRIVSYSKEYTDKKYLQHFVLNFLQDENLRLNSNLVRERKDKSKFVTKKDVLEETKKEGVIDKKWLSLFTLNHPEIFAKFKKDTINKIQSIGNAEIADVRIEEVTEHLISKLKSIPYGNASASEYHKTIFGIMELLFYPSLGNPKIEREINDGRKRIDITFDNYAENGFFDSLWKEMPCRFIMVECKNYSSDIANPELDQLSGRFSQKRGRFGIAACRRIENMKLFLSRCADTYRDDRGLIISLTDEDFITMLQDYPSQGFAICEKILKDKYRDVALR